MKCEICGHKIPVNQNECPNCGNKIEKEHQISYHVNSSSHEHVKVNQIKKGSLKVNSVAKIVLSVISSCLFINIFLGIVFSTPNDSFEDYIEEVGDKNDTVALAIQYRNKVEEYLENKNLHDIFCDEYVEDEDTLKTKCEFYCSDDFSEYTLSYTFVDGKQSDFKLEVAMENITHNTYNSLSNLKVFNELLDKDIIKVRERENSTGDQDVNYEDDEIRVYESGITNSDDNITGYSLDYTIAGNGYRIN